MILKSHNDDVRFRLAAAGSPSTAYALRTGVVFPSIAKRQIALAIEAVRFDLPRREYYGEGPDSAKSNRTDYRREHTAIETYRAIRITDLASLFDTCITATSKPSPRIPHDVEDGQGNGYGPGARGPSLSP